MTRAVVPNLFGTRDRFRGGQFFHGWGRGDGSGGNASDWGDGSGGNECERAMVQAVM